MVLGLNGQRGLSLNIKENKENKASAKYCVKLLGIEIDDKLKFNNQVKALRSKVNNKINAFSELNKFISIEQTLVIYNAVFY